MRKKTLRVATLGLFIMVAIASGYGQSLDPMHVKVPFQFTAAGETLPAGDYAIKALSNSTKVAMIRNEETSQAILVLTHPAISTASKDSRVVFHRYGDQYFLSSIWKAGDGTGSEVIKSRAERELEKGVSNRQMLSLVIYANR